MSIHRSSDIRRALASPIAGIALALVSSAIASTISATIGPAVTPASAQTPFYAGRTITFVSGSSPGASYDLGSRLIARHLARHIPGNPTIVVQNMPGAGSMAAANHLYNIAARDGSVIGMFGRGLYLEALFGNPSARFDPRRFNWIGSHGREVSVLLTGGGSSFRTLADVRSREVQIGSAPPGSDSHAFGLMLNALVGTRLKLVSGYRGMAEAIMAIDRGEVEGNAGASIGTLMGLRPQWLTQSATQVERTGGAHFILQLAVEPHQTYFKGVPLAIDNASTPLDALALRLSLSRMAIAYAFTAPPEVPADRVALLRAAFADAVRDPQFLAEAARANVDVAPVSGDGVLAIVEQAFASPPEVVARARAAMAVP